MFEKKTHLYLRGKGKTQAKNSSHIAINLTQKQKRKSENKKGKQIHLRWSIERPMLIMLLNFILTGLLRMPSCNVNRASLVNLAARRICISSGLWLQNIGEYFCKYSAKHRRKLIHDTRPGSFKTRLLAHSSCPIATPTFPFYPQHISWGYP